MHKRTFIALAAGVIVIAAIALSLQGSLSRSGPYQPVEAAPAAAPASAQSALPRPRAGGLAQIPDDRDEVTAYLQERYGKKIENPYIQMKMLEELIRLYQRQYPDRWQEMVLDILRAAFPERYEELALRLQRRLEYEAWMEENRQRLQGLSAEERHAALWEARNRIFGAEDAETIWASELRSQALADALSTIDGQEGASVSDRLTMYKQALKDIHADDFDSHMERNRHAVMNRFLGLASVQQALSSMSPEERARSLRDIRQGMGLDEAALARWDDLDRERDARWDSGRKYMEERSALTKSYAGEELEQELTELRSRYFGVEADVIAQEEASGFFRFDRPRRWGQD